MNSRWQPLWIIAILGVIAVANLGNAAWMLAAPRPWYDTIPGVPDFGPYNEHFVRDIGCVYLTGALALLWGIFVPRDRFALVAVVALLHGTHAILHVADTARGAVAAHHWGLELPTVYLPALLLAAVTVALRRGAQQARS